MVALTVSGRGPRADRHVVSRSEALGEVVEGSRSAGFGGGGRDGLPSGSCRCDDLGEPLGGCHPAERLSRSAVEFRGNSVELFLGEAVEVGALGEVLAQQPVGVLVRSALPRTAGIAEVDLDAAVDRERGVLEHLLALVPGQRATQLLGQRPDAAYQRVADRFGAVTVGERDELAVAGLALNQRRDPGRELAEQQIALPVTRDRTVGNLSRALGDHHLVRDLALPLMLGALLRRAA